MGWSRGSSLFSEIASIIMDNVDSEKARTTIYESMIEAFEDFDCDTLTECTGIDDVLDEVLTEKYDLEYLTDNDNIGDE